jgi:hypothetical protein
MTVFFVPVEDCDDGDPLSFAYLKMEDDGVVTAVDKHGSESLPPAYTVRTVMKLERVGLLHQVPESEARLRLDPERDRPKTDSDSW